MECMDNLTPLHFHPRHWYSSPRNDPPKKSLGPTWTASIPVLDVSTPACTNRVWPPLQPVSVAQKNKPLTMLSSNVQSIDLPMDCIAWWFWTMRQSNGCLTPAPRSSAAKQWFEQLAQTKKARTWRSKDWFGKILCFEAKMVWVCWCIRKSSGMCLLSPPKCTVHCSCLWYRLQRYGGDCCLRFVK